MIDRLKAELHKVQREIKTKGKTYKIQRNKLNSRKESTGEMEVVATLSGLFHVSKGFATLKNTEGTITYSKGSPMILCEYEKAKSIKLGDIVTINNNVYKITEVNNIQEYGLIADISMEVVLS